MRHPYELKYHNLNCIRAEHCAQKRSCSWLLTIGGTGHGVHGARMAQCSLDEVAHKAREVERHGFETERMGGTGQGARRAHGAVQSRRGGAQGAGGGKARI